eukprot:m.86154 g.86154  ORF g.86154 m.86154 type:complete len:1139 (+) comp13045_c0_seq2:1203-4619(+)
MGASLTKPSNTPLLNSLMALIYSGFTNLPQVIATAFESWADFIEVLSEHPLSAKRLEVLLKPLVNPMKEPHLSDQDIQISRIRTWWRFVYVMRKPPCENFKEVMGPLLRNPSNQVTENMPKLRDLYCEIASHLLSCEGESPYEGELQPLDERISLKETETMLLPVLEELISCVLQNLKPETAVLKAMKSFYTRLKYLDEDSETLDQKVIDAHKAIVQSVYKLDTTFAYTLTHLIFKTVDLKLLTSPTYKCTFDEDSEEESQTLMLPLHLLGQGLLQRFSSLPHAELGSKEISNAFSSYILVCTKTILPLHTLKYFISSFHGNVASLKHSTQNVGTILKAYLRVWSQTADILSECLGNISTVSTGLRGTNDYSVLVEFLSIPILILNQNHIIGDSLNSWRRLFQVYANVGTLKLSKPGNDHILAVADMISKELCDEEGKLRDSSMDTFGSTLSVLESLMTALNGGISRPVRLYKFGKDVCDDDLEDLGALLHAVLVSLLEYEEEVANQIPRKKSHNTSRWFAQLIQILSSVLPKLHNPGMLSDLVFQNVKEIASLMVISHNNVKDDLQAVFDTLASALERFEKDIFDTQLLPTFAPLFVATFKHRIVAIRNRAWELWNNTFGHAVWLEYDNELGNVISELRKESRASSLKFPGWVDAVLAVDTPPDKESDDESGSRREHISQDKVIVESQESVYSMPIPVVTLSPAKCRRSFLRLASSTKRNLSPKKNMKRMENNGIVNTAKVGGTIASPTKRKIESMTSRDIPDEKFKEIPPSPLKKKMRLTEHQLEVKHEQKEKRLEQPSLYTHSEPLDEENGTEAVNLLAPPVTNITSPISILKQTKTGTNTAERNKSRRVYFDLESNTNHVVARNSPDRSRFEKKERQSPFSLSKRKKKSTQLSPPPSKLSPGSERSNGLGRKRPRLNLGRSPRNQLSPLKKQISSDVSPMPTSSMRARPAVKRCLEPAMEPKDLERGDSIFPGLALCEDKISEVLPFFHVMNKRAVIQFLKAKKINTVGDICSLSQEAMETLPISLGKDTIEKLATFQQKRAKTDMKTPPKLSKTVSSSKALNGEEEDALENQPKTTNRQQETTLSEPKAQAEWICEQLTTFSNVNQMSPDKYNKLSRNLKSFLNTVKPTVKHG